MTCETTRVGDLVLSVSDTNGSVVCGCVEDRNHLFIKCDSYGSIWSLISSWLGFSMTFHGSRNSIF